ncbi:hypothetical protein GN958_ATG00684 [Phytophthora infestans]|uniref:Uncharacterized protein n=1 Tax=Phytophthora infestans TaxID=4787 RepID=A0A8S9VHC4_PHYIN|nr:hypothetical protein GN958_ATG00684 [Phytophthora infestans]
MLRAHLRRYRQQVALQRQDCEQTKSVEELTTFMNIVEEYHQKCVDTFKEFLDRHDTTEYSSKGSPEWDVFLSHYEALWVAFNVLYTFLGHSYGTGQEDSVLVSRLEAFELEVIERDEKIMLLQQELMNQRGSDSQDEYYSHNFRSDRVELMNESLTEGIQNSPTSKDMSKVKDPFLASVKPQTPADRTSGNGCDNEAALPDNSALMEDRKRMSLELEECLAKCAYLTSQNSKLAGRLKTAKETNEQHLKEQEELRTKLSARRSETTLEFKQTIKEDRDQGTASSVHTSHIEDTAQEDNESCAKNASHQEYEALREQLASREQENLALVQSLCTIKDKCAHMEAIHQKELRLKAAEHAESMESYMSTVNETLSCIESDRNRLEEENSQLRLSVQQLEDDRAQNKLKQSQRCTVGTNTELKFDMDIYTQEKVTLTTRIGDLELQLARERKLVEALEQKKILQIQHEQQVESDIKNEALKAQQEYEKHSEILQKWREKLRHEFDDYQAVQRAFQQESDKRIEFLSACIEEFARATEVGKTLSTQELYDVVMELSKQHKSRTEDQKYAAFCREDVSLNSDTEQKEPEMSEAMWWKVRAFKMEAYVRSAMLQNDTFEDTIRQLEVSMSNVKQELASRLSREAQLVSQLTALKSELATTKEQAASIAEKYQLASVELEKRQGEASTRGDETQRTRMAIQRKTELLSQQKAKVSSLQQELEQASKKLERLTTAEKQTAVLQQKAKEHTQQLLQARQCYEQCHNDNIQLSLHLEKTKTRHASIVTRLKAARAESANLRTELKNSVKVGTKGANSSDNQVEMNVSVASLAEETRALKRRVLQKQDVIVSYKAKLTEYEAQLERQRETMVKLARTNRELQQGQRQRQQQEQEYISSVHAKLETQLGAKQEQLDGLRASVYDSFEAFVYCQPPSLTKTSSSSDGLLDSPLTEDKDDKLFAIRRWTDFSVNDLEELRLTRDPLRPQENEHGRLRRKIAGTALQEVERALEANPEDCRAEICELLQCLYK